MTLLLMNSLNENGTSGMMDILPYMLSSSGSGNDQNSDMGLMLLLLGMGDSGNSSSGGLDPLLMLQLLGKGSSSESTTGVACLGDNAESRVGLKSGLEIILYIYKTLENF